MAGNKTKPRRKEPGKQTEGTGPKCWPWGYALAFLIGMAIAAIAITLLFGNDTDTEEDATPAALRSLAQLLSKRPEELEHVDIAAMNLLCAEGLPGSEDLDIDECLATIDRWAERVRHETERHLYRLSDPQYAGQYRNSEAYFRVSLLLQVLQEDCQVHYNKERARDVDFTNSRDLFLHGMAASDNGGTCVSMPVLYVAVGRRLGYPMYIVLAKGHVFARWDDPESGERFNIEGSGDGFSSFPDDYYKTWPMTLTAADLATGCYLKSLAPLEALAVFLTARAHCLEDTGRLPEARLAYAHAHVLDPKSPEHLAFLAYAVRGGPGRVAGSREPVRRDPMDEIRRIEAINEYNRRLMEQHMPQVPQVPAPYRPPQPPSPHVPGGAVPSGPPRPP